MCVDRILIRQKNEVALIWNMYDCETPAGSISGGLLVFRQG